MTTARAFLLDGFDDPALGAGQWDALLRVGDTDVVYLTYDWQRTWWETLGRGQLLLVAAERNGHIVALAPLFVEQGMIFFVGSGDGDFMDFIGDTSDPAALDGILDAAARAAADFHGFWLYGVPEASMTGPRLKAAAKRMRWMCYEKGRWVSPRIDLINGRSHAMAKANGRRVSKRERYLSRRGRLMLRQFDRTASITQRLDLFFAQHIERWERAGGKSLFVSEARRRFLHQLTRRTGRVGWPRLTWLEWDDRPIACEFGWTYRDAYFAEASCFDVSLASRSPGQVLQSKIVLATIQDGLARYEFGAGDHPYKLQYATDMNYVETWKLFPESADELADAVEAAP